MIKSLLRKVRPQEGALKLKFNKEEGIWMVLKGHSIMFMGQEEQCKTYMSQFG
ncbi:hypothetical protein [Reichenbachiella versicolor]|uniref:hypothetical protein n=1 Tax=Reichenbachiella versicolor TaxID=1821036 RepID=UPI0013A57BC1|nr:hypothetical protein [Reichenbachiella versicolor]